MRLQSFYPIIVTPRVTECSGGSDSKSSSRRAATRDRPEQLAACLDRLLSAGSSAARGCDVLVVDSSREGAASCRAMVDELARSRGRVICYLDRTDKIAWAERLAAESGVDPEVVRFALLGASEISIDTGSNRNAIALQLAGSVYLSTDDDVGGQLRSWSAPPAAGPRLRLSARANPTRIFPFADREALLGATAVQPDSIVDGHEQLVGRALGAILRETEPGGVDLAELSPPAVETVLRGRARVRVTMAGIYGDSGAASSAFYLFAEGCQLPADDEAYPALAGSGLVYRAADAATGKSPGRWVSPRPFICCSAAPASTPWSLRQAASLPSGASFRTSPIWPGATCRG
jgi:hypothetical protein